MALRIFTIAIAGVVLSAPWLHAEDLSSYRGFQFGMDLATVARQAGANPAEARVIHQRPAVIQELEWQPGSVSSPFAEADSVKDIRFSFYNGELFQMVVTYDRYRTAGLTNADMIAAISAQYGTATTPDAEIIFPWLYHETVKVIARWEDSQYSLNLVRSSYQSGLGIVAFSKRLEALARPAIVEAIRLDRQEAPEREMQRQQKEEDENRAQQEKARSLNKLNFHP
jgi:hypothetical protein